MGYYTSYDLTIEISSSDEIMAEFREFSKDASCALMETGGNRESLKWHKDKEELCEFSKKYPEAIFILTGAGDDSDDHWRLYVKNGAYQKAKATIEYEDFDPRKLTDYEEEN
jgi:hypothetical protein